MGRFEKRIFGWTSLIAYAVAACSFLLLAFACVNAISIKDGMLIIEERRFWKLKSSVRVPVSEIESVYLSDGDSKKHVVICCRDALESKYWFRMSWLSSFGNRPIEFATRLNVASGSKRILRRLRFIEPRRIFWWPGFGQ